MLQPEPVCLLIADISGYTRYLEPMYRDAFAARTTRLADQLKTEMAVRGGEQAEEPELPAPQADGVLASLAPGITTGPRGS